MVALIGASGSGKSTLIRHIAGLEAGDGADGRIVILDKVSQAGGKLAGGRRIGRVSVIFQQFNLVCRLSVLTNVLIGNLGKDRKSTRLNSSHVKISYAVFCLKKKKLL